eukprot:333266_1
MWPPPLMNLCLENFRNKTQTTSCHPTLHLTKSNPNTKNNMNRLLAVFIVLIMCGFVTGTTGTTATNEFNPNYQLFPQGTVNGFYEAENYCQTLGGHLASIHDATTNDLVSDLLRQNGAIGYGWIGFNKITNSWTDNSLVDYTADFIPSVHDECTAIAIYDESNKWTQVPCTNPYAFACYIPPSKFSHIGCFKDSESRALDDVDYGYGHSISECAQKCINYNYFSLQHDSYCFCENNMDDATRYGISDACINGLGGVWANDLYKQGITFNIVAWNEFHATVGYEGNFFGAYHSDIEQSNIANNDEIIVNGNTFIVNYF